MQSSVCVHKTTEDTISNIHTCALKQGECSIIANSHGNLSLYLFRLATTLLLANAMSSEQGDLLSFSNICCSTTQAKHLMYVIVLILLHQCNAHSKLFQKASSFSVLVNSLKSGNDFLQFMGRHTCVSTGDVVTEGIMDEHILVLGK